MFESLMSVACVGLLAISAQGQGCYEVHDSPGCDDPACEKAVCAEDIYCCEVMWDMTCVALAKEFCSGTGGGDCDNATVIGLGDHLFDTSDSTQDVDLGGYCDPGPIGDDVLYKAVWFEWTCDRSGPYEISTCSQAGFNTRMAIFTEGCSLGSILACRDDTPGCIAFTTRMNFQGVAGMTYFFAVGGFSVISDGEGTLSLSASERALARTIVWTEDLGAPEDTVYEAWRPAGLSTTWDACRQEAEESGDQLASVTSAEENAILANVLSAVPEGLHAFGLYQDLDSSEYSEPGGGWSWTDGTPLTYTNWVDGEPNDSNGTEHVGQMNGSGGWNDNDTNSSVGWTAYVTKRPGTPFSYTWSKEDGGNGHRYEAITIPISMNFPEAVAYAESRGGHLVTITSQEEQDMLVAEVIPATGSGTGIAVGLVQNLDSPEYEEPAGGWEWITGESVDFFNWNQNEPNDTGGEDFCEMYSSGTWNDLPGDSACFAVIIEYGDEPDCVADVNRDGVVDGADLTIVLGLWGTQDLVGDLDGNGQVDGADLTILLGLWGPCV